MDSSKRKHEAEVAEAREHIAHRSENPRLNRAQRRKMQREALKRRRPPPTATSEAPPQVFSGFDDPNWF